MCIIFLVFNEIGMFYISNFQIISIIYENNIWYLHRLKVYFILFDSIIKVNLKIPISYQQLLELDEVAV